MCSLKEGWCVFNVYVHVNHNMLQHKLYMFIIAHTQLHHGCGTSRVFVNMCIRSVWTTANSTSVLLCILWSMLLVTRVCVCVCVVCVFMLFYVVVLLSPIIIISMFVHYCCLSCLCVLPNCVIWVTKCVAHVLQVCCKCVASLLQCCCKSGANNVSDVMLQDRNAMPARSAPWTIEITQWVWAKLQWH